MPTAIKEVAPALSESAQNVFALLRHEALKVKDESIGNSYELSNDELLRRLIREAAAMQMRDPITLGQDLYDNRLYPLYNALRARLDGKKSSLFPGDRVIVGHVHRELIEQYPELVTGEEYVVAKIFYRYHIDDPYEPEWSVWVCKDPKVPPRDGWVLYDAAFFEKKRD